MTESEEASAKARELKKKLKKLAMEIIVADDDDDDDDQEDGFAGSDDRDHQQLVLGAIDHAVQALTALKEMNNKNNKRRSLFKNFDDHTVPGEFRCPISNELMKDPVVLATGQTYDRPFIHKWLKDGHRTCPQTQQVLSHTQLIPNHLVRELIVQWCMVHNIQLPPPVKDVDEGVMTRADLNYLTVLLEKLSLTVPEQKEAAKEIRLLTKKMPSFRSYFGEAKDAIPKLLNPLLASENLSEHPDLQEDLITVILNLSIHDNNKKLIGEHPLVIPLLLEALKSGTIQTKSNAAAALFTLSALDSNKHLIGQAGVLKPLIDLLELGDPVAMKDVAAAIYNLCLVRENRERAVQEGAVKATFQKITAGISVGELLSVLVTLATLPAGLEELEELDAVSHLLGIIRESSNERDKENCIVILTSICSYDRYYLKELKTEEETRRTISKLAANGTARAQRKAHSLLDRIQRVANRTNTA